MTRRAHRSNKGFTMIELIVAIALAVAMVGVVYSATRSMADVARRQQVAAATQSRWNSVVELFRRDVRGWLQSKSGAPAAAGTPMADETVLLQLATTADSIAGDIVDGVSPNRQRATFGVEYRVRKVLGRFELVRAEPSASKDTEVFLLHLETQPKLEFFDGKSWVEKSNGNDRPRAVRLTCDGGSAVVKL
jgi:prepilin-type N-terminal cleavage/methylation domain-containing protein